MARVDALLIVFLPACVAAIGIIDYLTGPNVGFSLFYLAPIVWSGWYMSRQASIFLALIAATSWLSADIAWHGVTAVSLWNGFTRSAIYVAMAWLTSRLRTEQQQLEHANEKLQVLLEQEKLLSGTDSLTGLPNRRLFVDELRRAIATSHRASTPIAVAYVDLDRFKPFNDRSGRPAGDRVLRAIADVLTRHAPQRAYAARVGGDEFAILLEQCTDHSAETSVALLLEHLKNVVGSITNSGVGINVGVACFERPPLSPDALIDHADAAMFCAKAHGVNSMYVTRVPTESLVADGR